MPHTLGTAPREASIDRDRGCARDRLAVVTPIGEVRWRERVVVRGHIRSLRLQPIGEGIAMLECTIVDATGGVTLAFLGRRRVLGLELGRHLEAEGMVAEVRERLTMINPVYRLLVD